MIILFDINVVLDALLDREPFGDTAALLIDAVERTDIHGYLGASSLTTLYYLMEKCRTGAFARRKTSLLLELFEIAPVTRAVLEEANSCGFPDFEDAVIYQCAVSVNADGIVTRNGADFKKAKMAVYSPQELLAAVGGNR